MTARRSRKEQRGIVLLALMVLMMVIAAAVMVNRAARISSSAAAEVTARKRLADWLAEEKYALIYMAQNEDSTPGAMPCPSGSGCGQTVNGISGNVPTTSTLDMPNANPMAVPTGVPSGACIQYIVAPSLRNILSASTRGTDPSQHRINPDFVSDLTFTANASTPPTNVWAVLLASPSGAGGNCNLASLGYVIPSIDAAGTASLSPLSNASSSSSATNSTITLAIYKKDLIRGLLMTVLQSTDTATLQSYLNTYISTYATTHSSSSAPSGMSLEAVRNDDKASFDAAAANGASLTYLPVNPDACPGVTSTSTSYKKPVSWLCFNAWYGYINLTSSSAIKSLRITDIETGVSCTRPFGGPTSCTP